MPFFFSVETLATVGYGNMYPESFYGHLIAMLEIVVGMFGLAVITGLIFVRFSRPTARLHFSPTFSTRPQNGRFFEVNRPPKRLNKGTGTPKCV